MLGDNSLSFVLCAHNARDRIGDCLSHLSRQRLIVGQGYEVVLVDNGSTDGTADLARQVWQREGATAPLRVVPEPRLGLVHARLTGIRAARHEVLSFVDDDTWMAPDWVATALRTMEEHPTVGLVGAEGEARFPADGGPPWFQRFRHGYAVGPQGPAGGGPVPLGDIFYGAGLTVRRSAVLSLLDRGFTPLLTGRTGAGLASGEDAELCLALVADGWDTWFQPSLRFQHLMTPRRLTEGYLEGLFYELGRSVPLIETYRQVIWQRQGKGLKALWRSPVPRVLAATAKLGKRRLARMGATSPADVLSARISAAFFRGQLRAYGGYWSQGPALRRSIRSWLDNPAQGTDHDPARYETHARAG